jgi:hypothetical protein
MANIINGHTGNSKTDSVCAEWKKTDGFKVNMVWKNIPVPVGDTPGNKNPYGSISDVPGIGPNASFCLHGNAKAMRNQFWVNWLVEMTETLPIQPFTSVLYLMRKKTRKLPIVVQWLNK